MDSVGITDVLEYAKNIMGYEHREARVLLTKELLHLTESIFTGKAIIYDVSIEKIQNTKILKEFTSFCGIDEDFQIVIMVQ